MNNYADQLRVLSEWMSLLKDDTDLDFIKKTQDMLEGAANYIEELEEIAWKYEELG